MILTITFFFIIFFIFTGTGFFFYKKNYLNYNLLRLDPLEELKIDIKLLHTKNKILNIWLLGDSRIAHWNKKFLLPLNANIVNLGIDGQTSKQVLNRFKNHLEFGKPDWIILEVGINDLKIIGLNKKLCYKISEECYNNIIAIIEVSKKNDIKIICCNIFPNGYIEFARNLVWNSLIDQEIIKINDKLKRYSDRNDTEYFDAYNVLIEDKYHVKQSFQNGFLHLNDQAYFTLSKQLIKEFGNKIKF